MGQVHKARDVSHVDDARAQGLYLKPAYNYSGSSGAPARRDHRERRRLFMCRSHHPQTSIFVLTAVAQRGRAGELARLFSRDSAAPLLGRKLFYDCCF